MAGAQYHSTPFVGVGLRHVHYEQALSQPSHLDFIEVHTENFFGRGGANLAVLERARELYPVSLHCTALGIGSARPVPVDNLSRVAELVERFDPMLVSDHLCFGWASLDGKPVHLGELLPVQRTYAALDVAAENIQRIQDAIGRPMLIENISSYVDQREEHYPEPEFLTLLARRTGCALLLDINNLVVNAHNAASPTIEEEVKSWLNQIPTDIVGEIHLAGFSPVAANEIAIDDHSQPVSELTWRCYEHALHRFGHVPTLIEWDTQLPDWTGLLEQAAKARSIGLVGNREA